MSPIERHARDTPDRIAYRLIPSGYAVTWAELERRTRQCAAALLATGLKTGDSIAVFLENHPYYFEILCAAHRIGLYYVTVSRHLKRDEVQYIVNDSDAKVLFCSRHTLNEVSYDAFRQRSTICVLMDEERAGFESYPTWIGRFPANVSLPETPEGTDFCYSSGTTGVPKGIKRPLETANGFFRADTSARSAWKAFDQDSVYLSTAPFYHTAPVRWNMAVLRAGGLCVMMEKFDPEQALRAIQDYAVTHSQWVPTMFIRLLRLPEAQRNTYDLGSLRYAVHAAAPCPVETKEAMIAWWGPILYEYYSGTELVGRTSLSSHEWLQHKGSVGIPEFGKVHIVDEDGRELGPRQPGTIYFSGGGSFQYHNDPEKTRGAYNEHGWATYGDIGYLDEDGFLYLTDRLSNTIVSGGVNIYPQEAENRLALHPAVQDVAVIGVPNEEFGEEVKAVVQLIDPQLAGEALANELIDYCRTHISHIKCPRTVDFITDMPRTESGKLLKRLVKQRYWPQDVGIAH
ncbi:acyl-CoA synthetase [Bordetella tumulicola]|uniref:acyl-CoA synthetase n=1 Tax=Bordetella tumulicola TaxID=1649133 RepID=UPI0039F1416C